MRLAVLQARMTSSRLPGKVLMPILGVPMLLRQIERVSRSRNIDKLVVATSDTASDDAIVHLCRSRNLACYRGSLDDVLDRFYRVSLMHPSEYIVRLTADCPLADPAVIDAVVRFCEQGCYDYASNTIEPTFPDGLDVEVVRTNCLHEAWKEAILPSEREHVTPFIHRRPMRFKIGQYKCEPDLSSLRWTVDEAVDLELITQIYARLYPEDPEFSTDDVLSFLDSEPRLKTMNKSLQRNEGMAKSMRQDTEFLRRQTTG